VGTFSIDELKFIIDLNRLVEIHDDRMEGYESACNQTKDIDLKKIFLQFKSTSQNCRQELIEEIEKLNGSLTESTHLGNKLFRAWINVKTSLTGNDRQSILNSCTFSEDITVDIYEKILTNHSDEMNLDQQSILRNQLEWIQSEQQIVKKMLDSSSDHHWFA
jgi:uncharacterized protein (TIGR02284 family)